MTRAPLMEGLQIDGCIEGTVLHASARYRFRNTSENVIELSYPFPLPEDATLLGVEVELDGHRLRAAIQAKASAERRYEKAIERGDGAAQLRPGLISGTYDLLVGNIKPGDSVAVNIEYAVPLAWKGPEIDLTVPTTIAPRFLNRLRSALDDDRTDPEYSLTARHALQIKLTLRGQMARLACQSPSHNNLQVAPGEDETTLTLEGPSAVMDRDIVIRLTAPEPLPPGQAIYAEDGDRYVGLVSMPIPANPPSEHLAGRHIIVVDCSGSMATGSIGQARAALADILASLEPGDQFAILAFGTHVCRLNDQLQHATPENLQAAKAWCAVLDANMGGTNIAGAVQAAEAMAPKDGMPANVLLVTDGLAELDPTWLNTLRDGPLRIFPVGLGAAAGSSTLADLARHSNGFVERTLPGESAVTVITRQFRRMAQPGGRRLQVAWPAEPTRVVQVDQEECFAGDTARVFAWFDCPPEGHVSMALAGESGTENTMAFARAHSPLGSSDQARPVSALARLGMAAALRNVEREDQLDDQTQHQAVAYQLLTPQTAFTVVSHRSDEERTTGLPEIKEVPQMLAAGWGGWGSVELDELDMDADYMPDFMLDERPTVKALRKNSGAYACPSYLTRTRDPLDEGDGNRYIAFNAALAQILLDQSVARQRTRIMRLTIDLLIDVRAFGWSREEAIEVLNRMPWVLQMAWIAEACKKHDVTPPESANRWKRLDRQQLLQLEKDGEESCRVLIDQALSRISRSWASDLDIMEMTFGRSALSGAKAVFERVKKDEEAFRVSFEGL